MSQPLNLDNVTKIRKAFDSLKETGEAHWRDIPHISIHREPQEGAPFCIAASIRHSPKTGLYTYYFMLRADIVPGRTLEALASRIAAEIQEANRHGMVARG